MKRFLTLLLASSFAVTPLVAQQSDNQQDELERKVTYMQGRVDSLNTLIKSARQR